MILKGSKIGAIELDKNDLSRFFCSCFKLAKEGLKIIDTRQYKDRSLTKKRPGLSQLDNQVDLIITCCSLAAFQDELVILYPFPLQARMF